MGGFALYCAYQSLAHHEAARENFLRGHRLGAIKRLRRGNFLSKVSSWSCVLILLVGLVGYVWFKMAFRYATQLTAFNDTIIFQMLIGCAFRNYHQQVG